MKSTSFIAAFTLLAAVATGAANAQTGRPAADEVRTPDATSQPVAVDGQLGSYGRYLMLNGATRDDAIAAAQHIDHPAARKVLARRDRVRTDAGVPVRQ
jgi:hypothetical protein